jgi:hypothetical protein
LLSSKNPGLNRIVSIDYERGLFNLQAKEGYLSNEEGIKATKKLIQKSVG